MDPSTTNSTLSVNFHTPVDIRRCAAIASQRAAEEYGLEIIAKNVQDIPSNTTRFLLLGPSIDRSTLQLSVKNSDSLSYTLYLLDFQYLLQEIPMKTSFVFEISDGLQAGALAKCLNIFSIRGINVTKLESRPVPAETIKQSHLNNKAVVNGQRLLIVFLSFQISISGAQIQIGLKHSQTFLEFYFSLMFLVQLMILL